MKNRWGLTGRLKRAPEKAEPGRYMGSLLPEEWEAQPPWKGQEQPQGWSQAQPEAQGFRQAVEF